MAADHIREQLERALPRGVRITDVKVTPPKPTEDPPTPIGGRLVVKIIPGLGSGDVSVGLRRLSKRDIDEAVRVTKEIARKNGYALVEVRDEHGKVLYPPKT